MEMYTLDTALLRLKEISEKLESGEYDLEMSIRLYEEGIKIISFWVFYRIVKRGAVYS